MVRVGSEVQFLPAAPAFPSARDRWRASLPRVPDKEGKKGRPAGTGFAVPWDGPKVVRELLRKGWVLGSRHHGFPFFRLFPLEGWLTVVKWKLMAARRRTVGDHRGVERDAVSPGKTKPQRRPQASFSASKTNGRPQVWWCLSGGQIASLPGEGGEGDPASDESAPGPRYPPRYHLYAEQDRLASPAWERHRLAPVLLVSSQKDGRSHLDKPSRNTLRCHGYFDRVNRRQSRVFGDGDIGWMTRSLSELGAP